MSHLTEEQRYAISVMQSHNFSQTTIATIIGKDKSVVSRELRHNRYMRNGEYRYKLAQRKYEERLKQKPKAVRIDVFFAHPYHSWERGANENMNGLIRQYIPKKSSFENLNDEDIQLIQNKLNNRPRKRLNFLTPIEYFCRNFEQLTENINKKVAFIT